MSFCIEVVAIFVNCVCNKCVCALGEAFEDEAGLLVNGCVVSVRPRGDRVSIWVGHKTEELLVTQIG